MNSTATLALPAALASEGMPWGIGWLQRILESAGVTSDWIPWEAVWLVQFFLLVCLAFHLLERKGPRIFPERRPGPFHHGWRADLAATILHGPVLSGLLEIAAVGLLLWIPALAAPGMASWPWAVQFLIFFLAIDFLRYWLHRWHHASPFLWRLHRVHHSAEEMTFFTSSRFHLGEALLVYVALPLPFKLAGLSPSVLMVYAALDLAKGFWQHANWRNSIGVANLFISSAEQHWWHHARDGEGMNANFGSFLSIWDRMFGTFYWRPGQWPRQVGIDGVTHFPRSYLGRFLSAWRSNDEFRSPDQPAARAESSKGVNVSAPYEDSGRAAHEDIEARAV